LNITAPIPSLLKLGAVPSAPWNKRGLSESSWRLLLGNGKKNDGSAAVEPAALWGLLGVFGMGTSSQQTSVAP